MTEFRDKAELNQHLLKQDILVFDVTIKANATPASKLHISDIPNVAALKTEGKSADADAIEVYTASPALVDSTGIFNVIIDEKVEKIYDAKVLVASAGTATVAASKTAGERILLKLDSNQDLSTTDLTLTLEVKCKLK